MGLPVEFFVYVGYGLFAMVVVFFGLNWMLGGLLRPFLEVKRSRGKKVLIRIRHPVQDYFLAGKIEENFLIFTDREGSTRRISMQKGVVSRAATIYWVEIDDEKNCFFSRHTSEAVPTYDPVKVDNLLVRSLVRPGIFGDQTVKMIVGLTMITLVLVIGVGFLVYQNSEAISLVMQQVQSKGVGVVS